MHINRWYSYRPVLNTAVLAISFAMAAVAFASFESKLAPSITPIEVERPRVIVLTDIGNEPDDAQSLVRFLLYSSDYDVEGLLATTSRFQEGTTRVDLIEERIAAFSTVLPRLRKYASGFPEPAELRLGVHGCQAGFGMSAVGQEWKNAGADHLIAAVDNNDPRPLWVLLWGGGNCLAQALWQIDKERSAEEVQRFVDRLRVYAISDQDDSGRWLRESFPALEYIVSPVSDPQEFRSATWRGISGDHAWTGNSLFGELFCYLQQYLSLTCGEPEGGPRFEIVDIPWLEQHIQKGALGALYPRTHFIMEGDSPSFMNLINNGLASWPNPKWGGWGGRYEMHTPLAESRPIWTDTVDRVIDERGVPHSSNQATIWRWREDYQWDFAARMQWSIDGAKGNTPHTISVAGYGGSNPLTLRLNRNIHISIPFRVDDPDGWNGVVRAWQYSEAGTAGVRLHTWALENELHISVPQDSAIGQGHIIITARDNSTHPLARYRRLIIDVGADPNPPAPQ